MRPRGSSRSIARLLCLVAALAGNPLRQAEAAEDFAHSLGEIVHPYSIEEEDIYLAADSGSIMIRDGHHAEVGLADFAPVDLAAVAIEPDGAAPTEGTSTRAVPSTARRRCAWLQRFLF